ncbi:hypothetical protein LA345_37040 (plasmid) [Burkholderia vietnamiensis]|uniref:Uncharacterized protein n=1 Tax=Burkholderia vietnamiensis (strain G4 / LMG 22486) TaxID=269482 RepID=A4JVD0_BURVG|nr:hypothetical protein Bcep1808_7356 [Burkholderia vietnamiensis G4]MCB4349421.1 hypothetical protein [Burkholderia vietnamiensis]
MGFFQRTGRFAVRQASYIAGYQHIAAGWRTVRRNWDNATKRGCPSCRKGTLYPFSEVVDAKRVDALGCDRCDYFEFAGDESNPESMAALRASADEVLSDASFRDTRLAQLQRSSRTFFALSIFCLALSVVALCLKSSFFFTAMMVALLLFVRGAIASYRFWQLQEDKLFVPGSLKVWIKRGAWFV